MIYWRRNNCSDAEFTWRQIIDLWQAPDPEAILRNMGCLKRMHGAIPGYITGWMTGLREVWECYLVLTNPGRKQTGDMLPTTYPKWLSNAEWLNSNYLVDHQTIGYHNQVSMQSITLLVVWCRSNWSVEHRFDITLGPGPVFRQWVDSNIHIGWSLF